MKKLFFLSLLALIPAIAHGQAKPPDVPDYVPVTITYGTDTNTPNRIGDGSDARGGVMPVLAKQPADIPSTASGWKTSSGVSVVTCADDLANKECKFRSRANISHIGYDDPIRNYGAPGASHLHCFFGSTTTNAYSTYTSLRNRANEAAANGKAASTFAGGPYNATGYWFPCVVKTNPFGDGKNYVVKPYQFVIYYAENPGIGTLNLQRLPRGLRYVLGTNMDDPDDCGVKNEISLANSGTGTGCTGTGTVNRYAYRTNGFEGWKCLDTVSNPGNPPLVPPAAGGALSPSLVNADGTDPWLVGGVHTCTAGMTLVAGVNAPSCYDGNNLWAPGGYKNFRYSVTVVDKGRKDCFTGAYRVPVLEITFYFKHNGWDDFKDWRLSSDDMAALAAGHPMPNGSSFHTDWLGAWDDTVFFGSADGTVQGWQRYCLNVAGTDTPHLCDSSTFNATTRLVGGSGAEGAPDASRNPQVSVDVDQYTTTTAAGMALIPPNKGSGPAIINAVPK